MNFSQQSIDFLFENRLHDSRDWYQQHKSIYQQTVVEPLTELINTVQPTMAQIDELVVCDPKRISRLFRDMRMHPDSIFRDHVWYTFSRVREQYQALPGFYFSIGAGGISYGMGYYCASTRSMEAMRKLILAGDKGFDEALAAYKAQNTFSLYGDMYKRDRYPDATDEKKNWLNRKTIGLSFDTSDPDIMFSTDLAQRVAADFAAIAPVYRFFMSAESAAATE